MSPRPVHETTEALEDFLNWATGERGLSRATARAYVRDLRLVAGKLEERHATRLPYATMTHLRRVLAALRADGVRADALAAVRVWGEFLVATGRVEVSPAAGLDEPSIQAVLPRHLRGPRIDPRLREFIEWGRRRRRWSEATVPNYHRRVVVFLDWAAANGVRVKRTTPADVRAFLTTLHPSPAVWTSGHSALLAWRLRSPGCAGWWDACVRVQPAGRGCGSRRSWRRPDVRGRACTPSSA